jgi:hypothetical protein
MSTVMGHGHAAVEEPHDPVDGETEEPTNSSGPAVNMREQVEGVIFITGDGRVPLPDEGSPVTEDEWDEMFGGGNGQYESEFEDDEEDLAVAESASDRGENGGAGQLVRRALGLRSSRDT